MTDEEFNSLNPWERYTHHQNDPRVKAKLRVRYGELVRTSTDRVAVGVTFGEVDGSPKNNIALTFLDGELVYAVAKPRYWQGESAQITSPITLNSPNDIGNNCPVPRETKLPIDRNYSGPRYKIGQVFRSRENDESYLLCQPAPFMACLVGLTSGNRWTEGAAVNEPNSITQPEFDRLASSDRFELVE